MGIERQGGGGGGEVAGGLGDAGRGALGDGKAQWEEWIALTDAVLGGCVWQKFAHFRFQFWIHWLMPRPIRPIAPSVCAAHSFYRLLYLIAHQHVHCHTNGTFMQDNVLTARTGEASLVCESSIIFFRNAPTFLILVKWTLKDKKAVPLQLRITRFKCVCPSTSASLVATHLTTLINI